MTFKKTKGAAPIKSAPSKKSPQPNCSAISSKSTATADQRARALELLKIADQTTYNLRAYGIAQCAARIFELRQAGYPITKTNVNAVDSDGYMHINVALYSLNEVRA